MATGKKEKERQTSQKQHHKESFTLSATVLPDLFLNGNFPTRGTKTTAPRVPAAVATADIVDLEVGRLEKEGMEYGLISLKDVMTLLSLCCHFYSSVLDRKSVV